MTNELTDVRCPCGDEYPADSYDAGFIAGSGMCQNCDAALPPKDICTCPSGDGSLVHPCPAHPASVEQAGEDERVIGWRERILAAHPNSDPGFWPDALLVEHMAAEIADLRAALVQPSPAPADEKPGDSILCYGCFTKGVGPDHFDEAGKCLVRQQLDPLNLAPHAEAFNEAPDEALRPEQTEAERPEVVAWQYRVTAGPQTGWSLWHSGKGEEFERSYTVERRPLMTVAQHERIVKAWIERWKAYIELSAKIAAQRDAALARVAELEKQEPVALANRGIHAFWVKWTEAAAGLYGPGIKLYAHPVAQAQHSVPEEFSFEYRHPNGECHTVTVSREQVINEMPDFLFEALCSKFCNCEPVGETNVVECCCDEYAEEFKLIAAAPGKEGL